MVRALRTSFAVLAFGLLSSLPAHALTFVDWTSVDLVGNVATGTLGAVGVTMTGTDLSFFQSNSTAFDEAAFCPPLANTQLLEFISSSTPGHTYTIQFSRSVHNPVIHLRSLGSRLTFPGSSITRMCGQSGFTVSGNQVIATNCFGGGPPPADSDNNGTIRVDGWVRTITFDAFFDTSMPGCSGASTIDGIDLQIGADPSEAPAAAPSGLLAVALLMGAAGAMMLRRSRRPASA